MLLVEAYLLDFTGDLYGELAKVRFHSRLRGQERFASVDELIEQMARDVALGLEPSWRRAPDRRTAGRAPGQSQAPSLRRWRFWSPRWRLASSRRRCESPGGPGGAAMDRHLEAAGQAFGQSGQGQATVGRLRPLIAGHHPDHRPETLRAAAPAGSRSSDGEVVTSKRTSARVWDVLTCCPPGPPDVENLQLSSDRGMVRPGRTARTSPSTEQQRTGC